MRKYLDRSHYAMGIPPIVQGASGNLSGDWVSLADYDSLRILWTSDVGSAGKDVTVALQQATTSAGGASKAVSGRWAVSQNTSLQQDALSDLGVVASWTDDGETAAVAVGEVTGDMLDDGYSWVRIRTTRVGGSDASKLVSAVYELSGARFGAAIGDQRTVLA